MEYRQDELPESEREDITCFTRLTGVHLGSNRASFNPVVPNTIDLPFLRYPAKSLAMVSG